MESNDLFQRILEQHTKIGELKDIESSEYKDLVKNAKNKAKEIITEIQRTNVNAYGNGWLYYVTDSIFNQLVLLRFLENIIKGGGPGEDYKIFTLSYYDPRSKSKSSLYDNMLTRNLNKKIDDRLNYLLEQYLIRENASVDAETPIVLINYVFSFIENNILPLDINDYWYLNTKYNEKFLFLEEKFGPSPSTRLSSYKLMVRFNQDFRGGRKKRKTRIKRKRNKKRKTKKNRFV